MKSIPEEVLLKLCFGSKFKEAISKKGKTLHLDV
jgi:hypothetical protein